MSNILIIGKDLPDGIEIAEAFAETGKNVYAVSKSESDTNKFEAEKIYSTTWNKSSAVSAHSLIIKSETKLESIDEVLFYFDTNYFCSKFELDKTEDIANAVDQMLNAFLYSSAELLKRIDQRKEKILVSFLVREYPSRLETIASKNPVSLPASAVVSAAQQAFISLAESFATNVADREYLSVILASCKPTNELYKNEKSIAVWLTTSMETVKGLKNPQSVKTAATWNKVGSKISTGFPFLK